MKHQKIILVAAAVIGLSTLSAYAVSQSTKSEDHGAKTETKIEQPQKEENALEKQRRILRETQVEKFDSIVK